MAIEKNFIVTKGIDVGATANVATNLNVGGNTVLSKDLTATGGNSSFGNVVIAGNLTVSGTTTYVNTATLNIADNIITLNSDVTGAPSENAGVEINRGTSANVTIRWNETNDKWEITQDGTNYGNIHSKLADIVLGTDTSGNYVSSVSSGTTAITIGGTPGEGWTPSVSIRTANTIQDGIVTLTDQTTNTNSGVAASATAVKAAADAATNAYSNAVTYSQSGSFSISGTRTHNANVTVGTGAGIIANGTIGTAGQVLTSNATTVYWSTPLQNGDGLSANSTKFAVLANNGIVANGTGVYVLANTGLVVNSTGLFVNSTYIGTLASNNASFLLGRTWVSPGAIGSTTANTGAFTTLAAGNTTVTGFVNVSSTVNVGGILSVGSNVVIGQATPVGQSGGTTLTLYGSSASEIKLLNSTTGQLGTDGTSLVQTGSNFIINNRESGGEVRFGANNVTVLTINAIGGVVFAGAVANITTLDAGNTTIAGSVNATGTVNASVLAVGTTFTANTTRISSSSNLFLTSDTILVRIGNTTSYIETSTTGVYPVSNTLGSALGASTRRWALNATTGSFAGAVSGVTTLAAGNTTITGFVNVSSSANVAGVLNVSGAVTVSNTLAVGNTTATGFVSASAGFKTRDVLIADGTSITLNADTTDLGYQLNTQTAGTLTVNAPTGTPLNGQKIILRLKSTNVQTFAFNSIFVGSLDLDLPVTSSGGSLTDYMGFMYDSTSSKWHLVAANFGF